MSDIRRYVKIALFTLAKYSGFFWITRYLTRYRLLILGYHGFAYFDEASFRPALFMSPSVFTRRMQILEKYGFNVITLHEAVIALESANVPPDSVVITMDDGFASAFDIAGPILGSYGYPTTLYVTTYYVSKGVPIYRLVIQYLFWKSKAEYFDPISEPWSPDRRVDLSDSNDSQALIWSIIKYGESLPAEDERVALCERLGEILGVDYHVIRERRIMLLLTPVELANIKQFGIDVQLHTHRHRLPLHDKVGATREIRDNRKYLEGVLKRSFRHFCYPSGVWDRSIFPILGEESIDSAVTCQAGLNTPDTSPFALYRILDQNDMADVEFEAELFGFCEILRILRGRRPKVHPDHRRFAK